MKKILFFVSSLFVIGCFVFVSNGNIQKDSINELEETVYEKIRVAVCPTCSEIAKKLDKKTYLVIETASTSESVKLFRDKQVDIILAGRTLKPGEPELKTIAIDEDGYSFLGGKEEIISMDEMNNYEFYTDLDVETLKAEFPIQKIYKVKNVYEYLSKGIIITSWDNTDHEKAKIIHVVEGDGERVRSSRQVRMYYSKNIEEKAKEVASALN